MKFLHRMATILSVLAVLGTICARSANAGEWKRYYKWSQTIAYSPVRLPDTGTRTNTGGYSETMYLPGLSHSNDYDRTQAIAVSNALTVEVLFQWSPSGVTNDIDPPANEQQRIYAKVTVAASASVGVEDGSAPTGVVLEVDDALGNTPSGTQSATSKAVGDKRLLPVPVAKEGDGVWRGRVTYTLKASAKADAASPSSYYSYRPRVGASASVSLDAVKDGRGVTITSELDTTFRREVIDGVPTRVANVPDAYGTIHAHTRGNDAVDPDARWLEEFWNNLVNQHSIRYNGNHWGDWSTTWTQHNYFEWKFAVGENLLDGPTSGEWDPTIVGGIPRLDLGYYATNSKGMPGQTENVHLKATAIDGAVAEADYFVTYHKPYEVVRITESKTFPQLPVNEHLDEWEFLTSIANYGNEGISKDVDVKRSKKGIITWSLSAKGKVEKVHVSELAGTYEETTENAVETAISLPAYVPAKTRRYFYQGIARELRRGLSSQWDHKGYVGDTPWEYISTSGIWTVEPDLTQDVKLDAQQP